MLKLNTKSTENQRQTPDSSVNDVLSTKTKNPILGQLLNSSKELISEFLYRCDFNSIQNLRRVASAFCYASVMGNPSPLGSRAIVPYYFQVDNEKLLKLAFAKKSFINTSMMISVADLIKNQLSIEETVNNSQMRIALVIENLKELGNFETFLANNPKFKFLNAIERLDIQFYIDGDSKDSVDRVLTTIFENKDNFKSLTCLAIKGIVCDFTLPTSCSKLKTFRIEDIYRDTFTIPDSCSNLETLDIKKIYNKGICITPCALPALTNLTLGCGNNGTIKLPCSLPRLINLKISNISTIKFFPEIICLLSLPKIETLTIETIGGGWLEGGDINLSGLSFKTLEHLIIGMECSACTLTLSDSFHDLTTIKVKKTFFLNTPTIDKNIFSFGSSDVKITMKLPGTYNKLNKLNICNVDFTDHLKSIQAYSKSELGSDIERTNVGMDENNELTEDNKGKNPIEISSGHVFTQNEQLDVMTSKAIPMKLLNADSMVTPSSALGLIQDCEQNQDRVGKDNPLVHKAFSSKAENNQTNLAAICRLWPHACLLFISMLIYILYNRKQG